MSVVVIVVVVVLLAIGYFFWSSKDSVSNSMPENETTMQPASSVTALDQISAQLDASASTDNTTELNAIDAEFK